MHMDPTTSTVNRALQLVTHDGICRNHFKRSLLTEHRRPDSSGRFDEDREIEYLYLLCVWICLFAFGGGRGGAKGNR